MPKMKIGATTLTLLLVLSGPSLGQEGGTIVARSPVELSEEEIGSLEERNPEIRKTLRAVSIARITYLSDGLRVNGYLAQPNNGDDLPCVIFNRGGNREFGEFDDRRAALVLARIARWGYTVVFSQLRGAGGSEGREEFGGADVNDVLNLIDVLENVPRADPSRIGMYGWSRGGLMAYLALARTDRIRAAIIGAGLADSFDLIRRRPEMVPAVFAELVPEWSTDREAALRARSPVEWVDSLHKGTPLLLLHGTSDWRVDPSQALRMSAALLEARHPFRLVMFEGGDHSLSEYRRDVNRLAKQWLDRYVRDLEPWPSLEPHGD